MANTVFINFRGGIISPGDLYNILLAAQKIKVLYVRFGLRQQLLVDLESYSIPLFSEELEKLNIPFEINTSNFPNIISSFPAEEVFIRNTWLSEGVYKDIFDAIDYTPTLKVNICDANQSFTPMLTGNINWVASATSQHYWHLIIRFPKTNIIYEWEQLCYTNDIPKVTRAIEEIIKDNAAAYIDNAAADGNKLFAALATENLSIKPAEKKADLPQFNLPYYEGLNRYDNKYWLGIYRRDEMFSIDFLKSICQLCSDTKLGQICCTAWKTIMIKGIEEKDKARWNLLLEKFQINMRHAANELNFQVEDNCEEGLALKNFLVKNLSIDDTRTFGICIGIKTRKKSEIFSSILVRKRYLIDFLGIKLLKVYDILCAKDFNPNERTEEIFSSGNPKVVLPEQLRRSVLKYYDYRAGITKKAAVVPVKQVAEKKVEEYVYQCSSCQSVYDPVIGDTANAIAAGTAFEILPAGYECPVCEAGKESFRKIKKTALGL
ncbi:rubredoxin [Ferruginibacter sp. SUN106]|uniref:rubredoxin n=1 Tax=Ferruginibacter sp. SUN106 TaxID=2978348 RepID=UPI003D35D75F